MADGAHASRVPHDQAQIHNKELNLIGMTYANE